MLQYFYPIGTECPTGVTTLAETVLDTKLYKMYRLFMVNIVGGMEIGPKHDSRGTIRRFVGLSESAICRIAGVTRATLVAWEGGHEAQISGPFRGKQGAEMREKVVRRLADIYAALMWIAGGCYWPRKLDDEPLRAAMERLQKPSSDLS
jgi:hypothetical protein